MELMWGVVGLGLAGFGFFLTSGLLAYFITTATYVVRHQASRNIYVVTVSFVGCLMSFAGAIAFVVEPTLVTCNVRRVVLNLSWTLIHAPVLVLCTVTWATPYLDEIRFCSVMLSTLSLVAVEVIILAEWLILRPVDPTNLLCEVDIRTYPYAMSYNYFIMMATIVSSIVAYCKLKRKITSQNQDELGVMFPTMFLTCTIVPTLAGWAFMMIFGLPELGKVNEWHDAANSYFMVATSYLVIFLYIVPLLCTMRAIKREEILDVDEREEEEDDGDSPEMIPRAGIVGRSIPMVGLNPNDRSAVNSHLNNNNSSYYQQPLASNNSNSSGVAANNKNRLRPSAMGNGVDRKLKSNNNNNNVGHLNATLELHEEDVMWKAGGRR